MTEHKFTRHDEVESYEDAVAFGIESRTALSVVGVRWENANDRNELEVSLSETPTSEQLAEIDDVLAATERTRVSTDGSSLLYVRDDQSIQRNDGSGGYRHRTYDERISELVGDKGQLGRNEGGVSPSDVGVNAGGRTEVVSLPDGASDTAKQRVEDAMAAFGRVKQ